MQRIAIELKLDPLDVVKRNLIPPTAFPYLTAAGALLDWEAPTGGYLLQASFATGAAAGRGALRWLESRAAYS